MENTADISRITENIWIGNGYDPAFGSGKILELHFDVDIDVEKYPKTSLPGVKAVIVFPVGESEEISPDQLALGAAIISEAVKLDLSIYVRSPAGRGRAPVIVAAYLVGNGMTNDQAMNFIRSRRGSITFSKPQEDALEKFEKNRR